MKLPSKKNITFGCVCDQIQHCVKKDFVFQASKNSHQKAVRYLKQVFLLLICLMCYQAASAYTPAISISKNDSIKNEIEVLGYYLNSPNWVPVDSVAYNMIKQLISFMENKPIDVVAKDLKVMSKNDMIYFDRKKNVVRDGDRIPGYISQTIINKQVVRIENRANELYPKEGTFVPETLFTGMYATLPLLSVGEEDRILVEGLMVIPDSIKNQFQMVRSIRDKEQREMAETNKKKHLEELRRTYNSLLVQNFRDSVSTVYRDALFEHYIDSSKQAYMDSVSLINQFAMKQYGDSLVIKENQKIRLALSQLLAKYDLVPNPITFYGLYNDSLKVDLINRSGAYKWLWLKNHRNDSVGVKLEIIDKHHVRTLVDERVNFSMIAERERLEVKKVEPTTKLNERLTKVNLNKIKVSPWKLGGRAYTGITQTYLNDTWKATKGGKSSASVITTLEYSANYSKDKFKWENGFNGKVGYINYIEDDATADPNARNWHKNSDNIDINSRLGLSAFKKWYYSGEMSFKTQSFYGYKNMTDSTPVSAFMSPGFLTFSLGMDYKPNKDFSAFLSPISLKTTYVLNDQVNRASYGLTEGDNVKSRVGMTGKIYLYQKLMENVAIKTNNTVFVNFNPDYIAKFPDFENETQLDFKVNQYITTQLNLNMIYDKDVLTTVTDAAGVESKVARVQLKQFVTFGFSYRF